MKHLYHILLFCCLALQGFAQRDSVPAAPLSVFTLGVIYGNTENYYGQSPADKLPYILSYAGYNFKSGFSLSASAEKLLNNGIGISAGSFSAGYTFKLDKKLAGNLGYTRYFYQKNSPLLQTANQNTLSSNLTYSWAIKSGLSANFAFGTEKDVFLSFSNSKMIDLGSIFSDKDYISIEPAVDIIGGTVHFYETYTTERNRRRQLLNLQPRPITTTVNSASFGILAYTFSLPLAYNRASYIIEASYQTSVPGQKFSSGSNRSASVFNLSFYYAF